MDRVREIPPELRAMLPTRWAAQISDMYEFGIDCVPLSPTTRGPFIPEWQYRLLQEMLSYFQPESQLGQRAGGMGKLIVADGDEKNQAGTVERILNQLEKDGITGYLLRQTGSGIGRHILLCGLGDPPEGSKRNLSTEYGAGEVGFGPGYAVAVEGTQFKGGMKYSILSGSYETIPAVPYEYLEKFYHQKRQNRIAILELPWRQPTPPKSPDLSGYRLSRRTRAFLAGRYTRKIGERSELDLGVMMNMINNGVPGEMILDAFRSLKTGKYVEKALKSISDSEHYLQVTLDHACKFASEESTPRIQARLYWHKAISMNWPGRKGATQLILFLAFCEKMHDSSLMEFDFSLREQVERSGISKAKTLKIQDELIKRGYIEQVHRHRERPREIRTWRITLPLEENTANLTTSTSLKALQEQSCGYGFLSGDWLAWRDIFRPGPGLGRVAEVVYLLLLRKAMTTSQLHDLTGRSSSAIRNAINNMTSIPAIDPSTGEVGGRHMVEKINRRTYRAYPIEVKRIAEDLGTDGWTKHKQEKHHLEREAHWEKTRRYLLSQEDMWPDESVQAEPEWLAEAPPAADERFPENLIPDQVDPECCPSEWQFDTPDPGV
jgi:hypothetical protein